METALMGGLVAQVERKLLLSLRLAEKRGLIVFFIDHAVGTEAKVLENRGALAEPFVVDHALDQDVFRRGLRIVFGEEGSGEILEFGFVFPGEKLEGAGETVPKIVLGDRLFTVGAGRAGGLLGIDAIGLNLGL